MDVSLNTKQKNEKAWWHWIVLGPLTPFFCTHGFRKLSVRESVGLVVISVVVIVLGSMAIVGWL